MLFEFIHYLQLIRLMATLFLSISVVIRLEQFEIYLLELLNSFGSFQQKKLRATRVKLAITLIILG